MVNILVRREFLDLRWTPDDLDAVAAFWMQADEVAAGSRRFSPTAFYSVQILLRGFVRQHAQSLASELARRAEASDLHRPCVEAVDPDTLSLATDFVTAEQRPAPNGLGLPILGGEPFEGLCAEFRVRAAGVECIRNGRKDKEVSYSLVLVGQLSDGEYLVKTVWTAGSEGWQENVYRTVAPLLEAPLLAGLQEFRESGTVPPRLARRLFPSYLADKMERMRATASQRPGGTVLPPIMGTVLSIAAPIAGMALAIYRIACCNDPPWLLFAIPLGFSAITFAGLSIYNEIVRFLISYRSLREAYEQRYHHQARYVPASGPLAESLSSDKRIQHFTAHLEDAGFIHAWDVADTSNEPTGAFRVFCCPDGATYIAIGFFISWSSPDEVSLQVWPPIITFQSQTSFPDDWRIESTNWISDHKWRHAEQSRDVLLEFPGEEDPIELYHRHVEEMGRIARDEKPCRHEQFNRYIHRQEMIQHAERERYLERPYSWRDHLRWYIRMRLVENRIVDGSR